MPTFESVIDKRGRITIPCECRSSFPTGGKVRWMTRGKGLVVNLEGKDDVEFLSLEYLQNQIFDLIDEIKRIRGDMEQLSKLSMRALIEKQEVEQKVK